MIIFIPKIQPPIEHQAAEDDPVIHRATLTMSEKPG
jgi:hypothetical protein